MLARAGLCTREPEWVEWTPQQPADAPVAGDAVTLGGPRPWDELNRQRLLAPRQSSDAPIGPALSPQAQAGLLDVLTSLDHVGVHLAEHRISSQSGRCSEFHILSPTDAVEWLESQPAVFPRVPYVLTPGRDATPVFSLGDLQVLDALHGPDGATTAPNPLLGTTPRSLSRGGFMVQNGSSFNMDPLQAYNTAEKRTPSIHTCLIPGAGEGFQGAQLTGPGCCSMTQKRPRPAPGTSRDGTARRPGARCGRSARGTPRPVR